MAALVESRGPDDSGEWTDPAAGIALGHRRLAIIDLSPGGRQPAVPAMDGIDGAGVAPPLARLTSTGTRPPRTCDVKTRHRAPRDGHGH